ncbi:helix-turn-helix domain-containing protein [Kocuria sp. M1R5S2]|uniref:helix-turn-helix domain-containing protein n=1 Tax=Kocuria rhizosphaerae TaxID=3376285 RepID=UPI0037AAF500
MDLPLRRSSFSTTDPAEGLAVLEKVFAVRGVRRDLEDRFAMSLTTTGVGPVTHERLRLVGSPAAGTTEGAGSLRVCHVASGALIATTAGDRFPRTGPFLLPRRTFTSWWDDLEMVSVSLDPGAMEDLARRLVGDDAFSLSFTGMRPVSPAMGHYWQRTVAHVGRDLLPNEHVVQSPLVRAEIARSLTTVLLHAFPNTFLSRQEVEPAASRSTGSGVRRAVAFIEAHLAEDIGLPEMAEAARMSTRGLQAAFRRELGTTPTARLREARLDAAHRDLTASDPTAGATVEAIAARWGFTHRGRFAAAYRARHGRSPAATLRG